MKKELLIVFILTATFFSCKKDIFNSTQLTNATAENISTKTLVPKVIVSGDKTITFLNAITGKQILFDQSFLDSTASLSQTPLVIGNTTILFAGDHIESMNNQTRLLNWYTKIGQQASEYGYYRTSPPFIIDSTVYFTSKKYSGIGKAVANNFLSVNLRNGHINWKQPLALFSDIDLPVQVPICTNKYAMVVVYNRLYTFDKNTGTPAWSFSRGLQFLRNPCLGDNIIFIAGDSNFETPDSLFAINAADGSLVWSQGYESYQSFGSNAAPAYANNKVFMNMSNGIICLNASTGKQIWQSVLNQSVSPMFFEGGKVYASSPYNNIVFSVNANNGSVNWSTTVSNEFVLANLNEGPVVVDNLVLVRNSAYRAVDKTTGQLVWSTAVNNGLAGNPPFTPNCTNDNGNPIYYGSTGMR
jgi:outer membrane protein assembly factor BamB